MQQLDERQAALEAAEEQLVKDQAGLKVALCFSPPETSPLLSEKVCMYNFHNVCHHTVKMLTL